MSCNDECKWLKTVVANNDKWMVAPYQHGVSGCEFGGSSYHECSGLWYPPCGNNGDGFRAGDNIRQYYELGRIIRLY